MTTTNIKAAACTIILWIVIVICITFLADKKSNPKEEYKSISLRLISSPVTQKKVATSEYFLQPLQQPSDSSEKYVEPKERKPTDTVPKKNGSTALVKSMEQLIAENSAVQKKTVDVSQVDWDSVFSQNSVEVSSAVAQADKITEKKSLQKSNTALFGSAVKGYDATSEDLNSALAYNGDIAFDNDEVSSSTVVAVKEITEKIFHMTSDNGKIKYSVVIDSINKTENSFEAGTQMQTLEGEQRFLLVPENPEILISADNEKLIDSSREVNISFGVLASGQVDSGSIKIFPDSLLPLAVKEEIKSQLAKWLFQPAFGYGQVCFKYNIMVR